MTIRFLADENFDHRTLAGLRRRQPDLGTIAIEVVRGPGPGYTGFGPRTYVSYGETDLTAVVRGS